MKRNHGWWVIITILVFTVGCSTATSPQDPAAATPSENSAAAGKDAPATLEAPAAALAQFLEALRTGSDEQTQALLTPVARQKAAALNLDIAPSASDTAQFMVGRVKYVGHDGAQVASTWTDLDGDGQPHSDEAVWVLRKETEGWRVAGVAAVIFPNEPPVLLNFEDPEDLKQKKEWVRKEVQRRMDAESLQAREPGHGEGPIHR
ncbi:MAG: hypothetical protein JXB10_10655 [Pirellulales bacterium]|nr:hypothetical protein [Pirellulales bacterium]